MSVSSVICNPWSIFRLGTQRADSVALFHSVCRGDLCRRFASLCVGAINQDIVRSISKTVAKGIVPIRLASEGMSIPQPEDLERFFTHLDLVENEKGTVTPADPGQHVADWDNLIGDTFRKKTLPSGGQAIILLVAFAKRRSREALAAFGASDRVA
jgi:hypothetical protein